MLSRTDDKAYYVSISAEMFLLNGLVLRTASVEKKQKRSYIIGKKGINKEKV